MEFERFREKKQRKKRNLPKPPKDFENYFQWKVEGDEEDIMEEELYFKPLSSGLGFDKALETNNPPSIPAKDRGLWEKPKYFSFEDVKKKQFRDTNLEPFFEPRHEQVFENIFQEKKKETEEIDHMTLYKPKSPVSLLRSFLAWAIDLTGVSSLAFLSIYLMFKTSGVSLSSLSFDFENILLIGGIWGFWYLSYFTLTDYTGQSFGKRVFSLRLTSNLGSSLSLSQVFLKSFFTLISILTLGLFSVMGGPSAGSQTRIIKDGA